MNIRLAMPADVAGVATLMQRYWEFESIGGQLQLGIAIS